MNDPREYDDAAVRILALDPTRSILLQAPAGSGKTTVLTLRFLTLLARVAEPEEILAITFTRKAAAEMRDRVQHALQGDLDPTAATFAQLQSLRAQLLQHAHGRGWDIAELPLRLRIQTIDSLNQYLASQGTAGATADGLQVTERPRRLHERAARRAMFDAERDPDLRDAMGMIFERLDNRWERAEQLLADLLERRAQWLPALLATSPDELAARVGASLRAIAAEALASSTACIAAQLRREAHELAVAAAAQRVELQIPSGAWEVWLSPPAELGADPASFAHWQVLAEMSLTQEGGWRKAINRNHGFPPQARTLKQRFQALLEQLEQVAGAAHCLRTLRDLPPLEMQAADAAALAALARVLRLAAAELQLEFAAARRVDYTMVAASAREALGEADAPSELAMRFGSGLRHLLVDEFQDTSVEQFALLEALVAGWQADDGRSLFLVGDPMQSIYQFRAAEVGLFLRARSRGIGALRLQSLALTCNFRSAPQVTQWINESFAQLLPAIDDLRSSAVRFLAAHAAGAPAAGNVVVHALLIPDVELEAQRVLDIVRAARERAADASIAILVAGRRHAQRAVAALRTAGVAVRGIDLEPLGTRPAVRDITALTRALLRPADRSAWLAVLRAPWCGLTLGDLTALCEVQSVALIPDLLRGWLNDPSAFAGLDAAGAQALRRCAPILLEGAQGCGRVDLAALVEATWLGLGGPASCVDDAALRDAESFFVALNERQHEGPCDEAAVDLLVESLHAQGESDARDAVEVLTIHRAKGLEWDVVILPGLGRRMRPDDAPLLRWIELPRGDDGTDLLMTTLSLGNPAVADPLNRYIAQLQQARSRNEKVRLAYVAATRARRELHLLGHAPLQDKTGQPMPPANSLLRVLWPALERQFCAALPQTPVVVAVGPAADLAPNPFLYRLPADWQAPQLPEDVLAVRLPLATPDDSAVPEYSWVGQSARATGTVVHAELEAFSREARWPPEVAGAERNARYDTALRQLGIDAAARRLAVPRIAAAVANTRADTRAAWIFSPAHGERQAELRLSGMVDGTLVNVSIDRSFIDEQGSRWVIDFKTSSHEGADLHQFLDSEVARYAATMRRYAELARQLGPEPVRAALYFPLLGAFREL
jgi:ATP-dependent helicase/nuclease subunit A